MDKLCIQVEILKRVINNLMITFDNENDRMDFILDICNEYKKEADEQIKRNLIRRTKRANASRKS